MIDTEVEMFFRQHEKAMIYSSNTSGPLCLFIYDGHNPHRRDGIWFYAHPDHGQMSVAEAKVRAQDELRNGYNVRIENREGKIVYFAQKGHVEFPLDPARFWEGAGK
jgi:hypothetical protein